MQEARAVAGACLRLQEAVARLRAGVLGIGVDVASGGGAAKAASDRGGRSTRSSKRQRVQPEAEQGPAMELPRWRPGSYAAMSNRGRRGEAARCPPVVIGVLCMLQCSCLCSAGRSTWSSMWQSVQPEAEEGQLWLTGILAMTPRCHSAGA
jgi:hypothetical protein